MPVIKVDVVWSHRAMDGTWCKLPYYGHPKGCPMYPDCIKKQNDDIPYSLVDLNWFAVYEEFNLENFAELMESKHPDWTQKQCRNSRLWQNHLNAVLFNKAQSVLYRQGGCIVLGRPEANGVNVFVTMIKAGVPMEIKNPAIVRKVMLVGIQKDAKIQPTLKEAF